MVTATIFLKSNIEITFQPGAALYLAAHQIVGLMGSGLSHVVVRNATIDGLGGTGGPGAGVYRANFGISFNGVTNFLISHCTITAMGCMNKANPKDDAAYAGFGITVSDRAADSRDGLIEHCRVSGIAGGGMNNGDGIGISKWAGGHVCRDIMVDSCWVSTCGRHCYSISTSTGNPTDCRIINSYGEKSGLSGVDIEDADNCVIEKTSFLACGNDQTFYKPIATWGSTFNLLAGVATGNASSNLSLRGVHCKSCYFGINFGYVPGCILDHCTVESSVMSDIAQGLASGAKHMQMTNCRFLSTLASLNFYSRLSNIAFLATGCSFAGPVNVAQMIDGSFVDCDFASGFKFSGGPGSARIRFEACTFRDWQGPGIDVTGANYAVSDVEVLNCQFNGTGRLTHGISIGFGSALRWTVRGCRFVGATAAGIGISNGKGLQVFAVVRGNTFAGGSGGIVCAAQGIVNGIIDANTFTDITGWCIQFAGIGAGYNLDGLTISNNLMGSGCTNGLQIALSNGAWDHTTLTGNNVHACTGKKWSLAKGNPNGFAANNIAT
jgi:hypothetical protein